jgi:apolipoprotein N-acyltransferase
MAPVDTFYSLFIPLPLLVMLLDGTTSAGFSLRTILGDAFRVGWCFGFGYHLVGVYWIGHAFLV